jgi:hypothetical protein
MSGGIRLSRQGVKSLLRTVGGKPHASSDDHAETADTCISDAKPAGMTEEDINAEPISSDDEMANPEPEVEVEVVDISSPAPPRKKRAQPLVAADSQKPRRTTQTTRPRVPTKGAFESGKREKEGRRTKGKGEDEKENTWEVPGSQSSSSSAKREAEEPGIVEMFDSYAFGLPKKQRVGYGSTTNIHAGPPKPKPYRKTKTFAGQRTGYTDSLPNRSTLGPDYDQYRNGSVEKKDNDSDISDSEMVPLPGVLREPRTRRPNPTLQEPFASNFDDLAAYRDEPTPSTSDTSKLPNLNPNSSGTSTPLSSVPLSPIDDPPSRNPQAPLENASDLQAYLNSVAAPPSDDKCPLCEAPVPQTLYWSWWKGKKMSVQQRSLFCHEHRKREAQEEYTKRGYPDIDWEGFPQKIEGHHPRLIALLRNDVGVRKSTYREAHRERVLAGERTTVKALMQREELLESKTGYYGTRGRRAMMEIMASQLADTIRECVAKDDVVSWGGMANFVQNVLVPELAIELVMEDMCVSEAVAKEIVEESKELGCLVNEEIEDRVEWDENDYHDNEEDEEEG